MIAHENTSCVKDMNNEYISIVLINYILHKKITKYKKQLSIQKVK